jgi:hypothetical protein
MHAGPARNVHVDFAIFYGAAGFSSGLAEIPRDWDDGVLVLGIARLRFRGVVQ